MKKIKHLEYLPLIIISMLVFKLVSENKLFVEIVERVVSLSVPFFWAIAIAYLLHPIVKKMQVVLKFKKWLAMSVAYLLVLLILAALIIGIIPSITNSITDMVAELPSYGEKMTEWYENRVDEFDGLQRAMEIYKIDIKKISMEKVQGFVTGISSNIQDYAIKLGQTIFSITTGFLKFIIGLAMSVYILRDREKFIKSISKFSSAYFGEPFTRGAASVIHDIDDTFGRYLVGKSIDSLIIGVLCFIGLSFLRIKFTLLFSVIVGVTNMIPYFGPIIGAVPAVLVTLFISPIQALWVAIFILILQQLDGNVIGPKIIGDSIGVSPFWIIFAVFVGGNLFGFWGMLLGVPAVAVILKIIEGKQEQILKNREEAWSKPNSLDVDSAQAVLKADIAVLEADKALLEANKALVEKSDK